MNFYYSKMNTTRSTMRLLLNTQHKVKSNFVIKNTNKMRFFYHFFGFFSYEKPVTFIFFF